MKFSFKEDAKRIVVICIASVIMALNIKTFVRTGGLYPGGATGLTLLIQRIVELFFGFESAVYDHQCLAESGADLYWFSFYWQEVYTVFVSVYHADEYTDGHSSVPCDCL